LPSTKLLFFVITSNEDGLDIQEKRDTEVNGWAERKTNITITNNHQHLQQCPNPTCTFHYDIV
jgi:hypothetical protein